MRVLADETQVDQLIRALAHAIASDVSTTDADAGWALVGIRDRGDLIANRLAQTLVPLGFDERVGVLDITLYRDDLSEVGTQAVVRTTEVPFPVDGLNIVLVDDVLMTGRSVRAAMQSLIDLGRPRRVWLSVLADRGGRELPIAPDHVALDLSAEQVAPGDRVEVHLKPLDKRDEIIVRDAGDIDDTDR